MTNATAEIDDQLLEERKHERGRDRPAAEMREHDAGEHRDDRLDDKPRPAGKAGMGLLRDLQIVVVEADQPEARASRRARPRRRGCAGWPTAASTPARPDRIISPPMVGVPFLVTRCDGGPSLADRLALALLEAQHVDDRAAEQEDEDERGDDRAAGAEGDVAKDVEERDFVGKLGQPIEHRVEPGSAWRACASALCLGNCCSIALTIGPIFEPSEPFTITASPARMALEHRRLERRRASRHSRPGASREAPPTARASAGRSKTRDRCRFPRSTLPVPRAARAPCGAEFQHVAEHGDAPALRPDRRPGRAARSRRASRPDWRCSSRRSAERVAARNTSSVHAGAAADSAA